jgi:hypothetical protein
MEKSSSADTSSVSPILSEAHVKNIFRDMILEHEGLLSPQPSPQKRRYSVIVPGTAAPRSEPGAQSTGTTPTVIYKDFDMPEDQKMQKLTINSLIHFKHKLDELNLGRTVKLKLQQLMTSTLLKDIWGTEDLRQTEFAWTGSLEDLQELSHDRLMVILARCLRPTGHQDYIKKLATCLSKIKAPPGVGLDSEDYDLVLFKQISKHFLVIRECDEFMRYGASAEEIAKLPHLLTREGSREGLGLCWIALATLGNRFAEHYKSLLGVEAIKNCKTFDEFIDLALQKNRELALLSKTRRERRQELEPKQSFNAIAQLMDALPDSPDDA